MSTGGGSDIHGATHFALECHGRLYSVPLPQLSDFLLLQRMALDSESNADGGLSKASDGRPPLVFPLPEDRTVAALEALMAYTRLRHRTPADAIGRQLSDFSHSITAEEERFLAMAVASTPVLLETLALADYVQHANLLVLLSGALAQRLAGKSTTEMREVLGITRDAELFHPWTLAKMTAEAPPRAEGPAP